MEHFSVHNYSCAIYMSTCIYEAMNAGGNALVCLVVGIKIKLKSFIISIDFIFYSRFKMLNTGLILYTGTFVILFY